MRVVRTPFYVVCCPLTVFRFHGGLEQGSTLHVEFHVSVDVPLVALHVELATAKAEE